MNTIVIFDEIILELIQSSYKYCRIYSLLFYTKHFSENIAQKLFKLAVCLLLVDSYNIIDVTRVDQIASVNGKQYSEISS